MHSRPPVVVVLSLLAFLSCFIPCFCRSLFLQASRSFSRHGSVSSLAFFPPRLLRRLCSFFCPRYSLPPSFRPASDGRWLLQSERFFEFPPPSPCGFPPPPSAGESNPVLAIASQTLLPPSGSDTTLWTPPPPPPPPYLKPDPHKLVCRHDQPPPPLPISLLYRVFSRPISRDPPFFRLTSPVKLFFFWAKSSASDPLVNLFPSLPPPFLAEPSPF